MSPVDPFFAQKFELFESLPDDAGEMGWMSLIGAEYQEPISEYQSPDVTIENRSIPGPRGRFLSESTAQPALERSLFRAWSGFTVALSCSATLR